MNDGHYLELKEGFFDNKMIKRILKLPGGNTYVIIFLKMILSSMDNHGRIVFDGFYKDIVEEISIDIGENKESVKITIEILSRFGLIGKISNCEDLQIMPPLDVAVVCEEEDY